MFNSLKYYFNFVLINLQTCVTTKNHYDIIEEKLTYPNFFSIYNKIKLFTYINFALFNNS